ncbi:MAG: aldolase/citrate lyase family protein [Gemmatimonadota bacterium]|nr:aldolase/citrate lyase family protein [Gemmatimonadota bacterium]MDH3476727.1 aldolase/citrate lyase family protein [Gemmatimonadota bacterium]MDH3569237.1 aldolase/citrate lyase family protein [Gemmatimonadota bacterium]MDH5549779.1 aldolase/citrate lyase family protein [Gemmatimonadota bacterium]
MSARGAAGRQGDDVRSDLHVAVELTRSGGQDIDVASRVATFYGRSIEHGAVTVLDALGVKHVRVRIDDTGALPFTIAARVEAALRRAGVERAGDARPARTVVTADPSPKTRLRRSRLYLPGNEPKFMVNAGLYQPDAVILDLEDSVHPAEKDAARLLVRNALRSVDFGAAERMVRINQLPMGFEDLDAVIPEEPDLILIPKTEQLEQVRQVHERILEIQQAAGNDRPIWLMPIIESARGVEHAYAIAKATDAVVALTIGLEDYTADLGVVKTVDGAESLFARSRLVNAARAAGVQAIDSVFGDVGDEAGLAAWARRSRGMGFEGMGCVHPRQVQVIHAAFTPSDEEIEKALQIVAAFEEAQAKGLGVVSLGTRMVDPPVVLRAQRLVAVARRSGRLPEAGRDGGTP